MPKTPSIDLLRRLCLAPGPPGAEDAVRAIVRDAIAGVGELSFDRLGSVLCEVPGSADAPRIVLDCHLDEVGFMVQSISREGRVRFVPLGGWWGHVLLGKRVDVLASGDKVPGVIAAKSPHFLGADERNRVVDIEAMYIDLGATDRAQVEQLGVRIGDPIAPHGEWVELGVEGALSCKAFDNRAGVGVMCEVLASLAGGSHPNTLVGVGSVQEEIGLRGAETSSRVARPDLAIVLECAPADDGPGVSEPQGVLGGGPQIRHYDPTAVGNRRLIEFVDSVADTCGIPIQHAVRRTGGTDAGAIHRHGAGVPAVVVAVPARYIHTHTSVLQWSDYEAACRLVGEIVSRLDASRVEAFTRFGSEA
jgi:endoglucanase